MTGQNSYREVILLEEILNAIKDFLFECLFKRKGCRRANGVTLSLFPLFHLLSLHFSLSAVVRVGVLASGSLWV